jgi:hypothetical protein
MIICCRNYPTILALILSQTKLSTSLGTRPFTLGSGKKEPRGEKSGGSADNSNNKGRLPPFSSVASSVWP